MKPYALSMMASKATSFGSTVSSCPGYCTTSNEEEAVGKGIAFIRKRWNGPEWGSHGATAMLISQDFITQAAAAYAEETKPDA